MRFVYTHLGALPVRRLKEVPLAIRRVNEPRVVPRLEQFRGAEGPRQALVGLVLADGPVDMDGLLGPRPGLGGHL